MREFKLTTKGMHFTNDNYGVSVFYHDLIGGRGILFFLKQFRKALCCYFGGTRP